MKNITMTMNVLLMLRQGVIVFWSGVIMMEQIMMSKYYDTFIFKKLLPYLDFVVVEFVRIM